MLLRGDAWSEAWISLRRAHKDRRARKQLRNRILLALIPVLCLVYLAWLAGSGAWLMLPILVLVLWWQSRMYTQEECPISVVPAPPPVTKELTSGERQEFRQYFGELALIYAVLLDRAASEHSLRENELPEGFEVATRRSHLDLLKKMGVWDRMAQVDRESIIMPDGTWEKERIQQVIMGFEPLRLLRWLLRIDFHLPLVGRQLKFDCRVAHDLVKSPEKLFEGTDLVSVAALETACNAAENFYHRCVAEQIFRGDVQASDDDSRQRAMQISRFFQAKQHEDLVLGVKLVSEASSEELNWASNLAWRRVEFLQWAMKMVQCEAPPEVPYRYVA